MIQGAIDPLILTRAIHFAATILAGGTVGFMVLVANIPALRRRLVLMTWLALAVSIISGLVWLLLLAAGITGAPLAEVGTNGDAWKVAAGTHFGQVMGARLLLAIALGLLMSKPGLRFAQLAAAAVLVALLAFVGHAGATPGAAGAYHLAADIVHVVAAAAWLGALPGFVLLLAQAKAEKDFAWLDVAGLATARFSRLGLLCVAALLASGAVNSWYLLTSPGDLVSTDYGRVLSLKIALFAAMVAIAALNKYRLTPRLAAPEAIRAMRRNSLAEIGLGLGVLLLAGALGSMEPAADAHHHDITAAPPDAAYAHIHDPVVSADVILVPGRPGRVKATIRLTREDHSGFPARELALALDPPAPGPANMPRPALRMPDGGWQIEEIEVPQPGVWTARVIVTPAKGPAILLDGPIVIEP